MWYRDKLDRVITALYYTCTSHWFRWKIAAVPVWTTQIMGHKFTSEFIKTCLYIFNKTKHNQIRCLFMGYTVSSLFHERFFRRNSNSMENWSYCNSIVRYHIAAKVRACHESPAVVPYANLHSDHNMKTWMKVEWNFHRIWITIRYSFMKGSPGKPDCSLAIIRHRVTAKKW